MSTYHIKADAFVLPGSVAQGGYLTVADGSFGFWSAERPEGEVLDLTGTIVAPGLVDTHIHGFFNHATTDCDPDGINVSSLELARRGTTAWIPTTFTDDVERIGAADHSVLIVQVDAIVGADEGDRAVHGTRIQLVVAEPRRQDVGDGGFARTGRAVDRDDHARSFLVCFVRVALRLLAAPP